jgi:hypothetical protein
LKDTTTQLEDKQAEAKRLSQALAQSKADKDSCEAKNDKLYEYGQAILQNYRKKGVWDALTQKDPVFGVKDVEIENLVQEYRDKLDSQKMQSKAR